MKHSQLLASLVLGGTLIAGTSLALHAREDARAWAMPQPMSQYSQMRQAERPWLSIAQINDRLGRAGFQHIEKISRSHGYYKVKATDNQGRRIKLYLHPTSGELLDKAQAKELKRLAKAGPMTLDSQTQGR